MEVQCQLKVSSDQCGTIEWQQKENDFGVNIVKLTDATGTPIKISNQ